MDNINIHALLNYWRGLYKILEEDWQQSAHELGLTPAEEHLLWIIHFEKEITISEIAKIGLWELSTAMQIVNRARTKGLIYVKKKDSDKRITYVSLTEKGVELQNKSQNNDNSRIVKFLKEFSEKSEENQRLIQDLSKTQKLITEHFYGKEYVYWIERTKMEISHS